MKTRFLMMMLAGMATQAAAQTTINCTAMAEAASGRQLIHEGRCGERVRDAFLCELPARLDAL